MTSSNTTFPKTPRNTTIAFVFLTITTLTSIYLFYQVNALDEQYGKIIEDEVYFRSRLKDAQTALALTRIEIDQLAHDKNRLINEISQIKSNQDIQNDVLSDLMDDKDVASNDLDQLSLQLEDARKTISTAAALKTEISTLEQNKRTLQGEIVNMQTEFENTERNVLNHKSEITAINEDIARLISVRDGLQGQIDEIGPQVTDTEAAKRRVELLQKDEERLNQSISGLTEKVTSEQERLAHAIEEVQDTREQLATGRTEMAGLTASISARRSEISELKQKQDEIIADITIKQATVSTAERRAQEATSRLEDVSGKLEAASARQVEIQTDIENMEKILVPLRNEAVTTRSNINGLNIQAQDIQNQITNARTQLDDVLKQQTTERERLLQLQVISTDASVQ